MDESPEPLRLHVSGLLDLQNALNDLEEVADAFREWSGDPGLSPLDVLIGKGPVNPQRLELIEGLAELLMERQGGDPLKPPSYLGADSSSTPSPIPDGLGERSNGVGPRFRVIRHHAEGGLGSVSVAIDKELNREVALKQILDRHADNEARRARFLVEAEITGGLEHPGIVPVYSLGHSADGRPYYAMRFIRGETLADAITRFHARSASKVDPGTWSLELRKLLRRFVDVCNAAEYAHGRGILHRDLKPSNVMVGKHGETLVVDWGLAKAMKTDESGADDEGPLTPSSGGETLPGSAVGTPSFMSPEQAAGVQGTIGPASDVYSLGATLFCLLTGRPAFDSGDPERTLKEVQAGTFPPPRRANALVPRPLEAICLKAMEREPGKRYQSARALADDIDRWMADEPVSAYGEPLADRARRWARRRRSAVTSAVAALLVALIGLGVVLIVQTRANDRLQQANSREKQFNLLLKDGIKRESRSNLELQAANERVASINKDLRAANERERVRFDLALDAIRLFHSEVSDDFLLKETEFSGLRANLLRGALDFYAKLRRQLEEHPDRSSREAIARVYGQLAELEANVGTSNDALRASRSALEVRRMLAKETPGDLRLRADLASSLISLGILSRDHGNSGDALKSLDEARTILEDVAHLEPSNLEFKTLLGDCHFAIGEARQWTGERAEAMAAFDRALQIREPLALADRTSSSLWMALATTHQRKAFVHSQGRRPREAIESLSRALPIVESLVAAYPFNTRFRFELSAILKDRADMVALLGGLDEALGQQERALAIRESLSAALPGSVVYRTAISHSLLSLGHLYAAKDRRADSISVLRRSAALQESLPGTSIGHFNLGFTRALLSSCVPGAESSVEANRAARALRRAVESGFPDFPAIENLGRRYPTLGADRDFRLLILDHAFPPNPFSVP